MKKTLCLILASMLGASAFGNLMMQIISTHNGPAVVIDGVTYYLPAYAVTEPTTNYPGATFSFVGSGTATVGTPEINEWTVCADSGDSIIVSAENLDERSFFVFVDSGGSTSEVHLANMIKFDGDRLATVELPHGLESDDSYLMWAYNASGFGEPVLINQTIGWDTIPRYVWTDREFNIIGRNLELGGTSYVYVKELDLTLSTTNCNPYRATYNTTSAFTNGVYTLYPHNGTGGKFGWETNGIILYVTNSPNWEAGAMINVTAAPYNAVGDGVADDRAAINAAVAAASAGDTIYFPAGRYATSDAFSLKDGTRWLGDGTNSVITTHHDFAGKAQYSSMISMPAMDNYSRFENLWFESGTNHPENFRMISSTGSWSKNTEFKNVTFSYLLKGANTLDAMIYLGSGTDTVFTNCTFYFRQTLVPSFVNLLMQDCHFYGLNDCEGMLSGLSDPSLILGCDAQPYDIYDVNNAYGWTEGRFLFGNKSLYNIVVDSCTATNMGPRDGTGSDGNSGELFLGDGLGPITLGSVVYSNAITYTMAGLTDNLINTTMSIVQGRGLGQSRRIINDTSGGIIIIDRPFNTAPNTDSVVVLSSAIMNWNIYNNTIHGLPSNLTPGRQTASVAFSSYGASANIILDCNRFHDTSGGIVEWSHDALSTQPLLGASFFNLFANNSFDGLRYAHSMRAQLDYTTNYTGYVCMAGRVNRGNSFDNLFGSYINVGGGNSKNGFASMTLFDQETVSDGYLIVTSDAGQLQDFVVKGSDFSGIDPLYSVSDFYDISFLGNTSDGTNVFNGNERQPAISFPNKTVNLADTTNAPINNIGTYPAYWTASETSAWLSVTPDGTLAEQSSGNIGLVLDSTPTNGTFDVVQVVTPAYSITNQCLYFNSDNSWFGTGVSNGPTTKVMLRFKLNESESDPYDRIIGVAINGTDCWAIGRQEAGQLAVYYNSTFTTTTYDQTEWYTYVSDINTGRYNVGPMDGDFTTDSIPSYEIQVGRTPNSADRYAAILFDRLDIWEGTNLIRSYHAEDAYGTTLPDRTGNYDATLVNCTITNEVVSYPATTNTFTVIYGDELGTP